MRFRVSRFLLVLLSVFAMVCTFTLDIGAQTSTPTSTPTVAINMNTSVVFNGSFEVPLTNAPSDTYYAGSTFGGWSVESGSIDHISAWQAAEGNQSVDLSGVGAGAIYQDLPTSAGENYSMRIALSANPESPSARQIEIWFGDQLVDTVSIDNSGLSPSDMNWVYHEYSGLKAKVNLTRLRLVSLSDGVFGPAVDNISVFAGTLPAVTATPTPIGMPPLAVNMSTGHIYTIIPDSLTWTEAKTRAETMVRSGEPFTVGAGHLATFSSLEEQNWVLENLGITSGFRFWIGGSQASDGLEPDGGWQWITGEQWGFTKWAAGEPNESNPNEDYLMVLPSSGGVWNDAANTDYSPAIVEFDVPGPIIFPTPTPTPAPIFNPTTGHYYLVPNLTRNWFQAKAQAESMQYEGKTGYLATLTSQEELDWVKTNLSISSWPVWLGGFQATDGVEPGAGWQWVTGEPFLFQYWQGEEPNEANAGEDSLEMSSNGRWNDALGTQRKLFIVEFGNEPYSPTPTPTSPPTLNPTTGHYYMVLHENLTWPAAKARAESLRWDNKYGYLATFANQNENDWVINNLSVEKWPVWVGGYQALDWTGAKWRMAMGDRRALEFHQLAPGRTQ